MSASCAYNNKIIRSQDIIHISAKISNICLCVYQIYACFGPVLHPSYSNECLSFSFLDSWIIWKSKTVFATVSVKTPFYPFQHLSSFSIWISLFDFSLLSLSPSPQFIHVHILLYLLLFFLPQGIVNYFLLNCSLCVLCSSVQLHFKLPSFSQLQGSEAILLNRVY